MVIIVGICKCEPRYGLRSCPYVDGDESSWECLQTEDDVVKFVLEVVRELGDYGITHDMSMLAPSAGVDTILSIVSGMRKYGPRPPSRLSFFCPIAGAYHPSLYNEAAQVFKDHGTHILVHSHVGF